LSQAEDMNDLDAIAERVALLRRPLM